MEIVWKDFNGCSKGFKIIEMEPDFAILYAAMQQGLDRVRHDLCKAWSKLFSDTSGDCQSDLSCARKGERGTSFQHHWCVLLDGVQELITPLCLDLRQSLGAQKEFDPCRWVSSTAHNLLMEEVVCRDKKKNVAHRWIEAAIPPELRSNWHTWANIYESASPDADGVMRSLLQSFLKATNSGFKNFHAGSFTFPSVHEKILYLEYEYEKRVRLREQPASTGDKSTVEGELVLRLKFFHDRHRRREQVHKLFPILVRQIEEAWTARSQRRTREEILKRFELLGQVEPTEFDDILKNNSGWDAGTWAVQIIRDRTGLAPSTIRKYGQPGVHRGQRQSGSLSTAA